MFSTSFERHNTIEDLEVGTPVKIRGSSSSQKAIIIAKRVVYDLKYDDGRVESDVSRNIFEELYGGNLDEFSVGDTIEARFRGQNKYFKGKITQQNSDGTFDIVYDDGDKEFRVNRDFIRPFTRKSASPVKDQPTQQYRVGAKVEARYKQGLEYLPGVVTRKRLSVVYDVTYENGEIETNVPQYLIKNFEGSHKKRGHKEFGQGSRVEARFRGHAIYLPGTIVRDHGDGKYDINYDNGSRETSVYKELIRPFSQDGHEDNRTEIQLGAQVEVRYKGKSKYLSGVVTRKGLLVTYDVGFNSGDSETEISVDNIRPLPVGNSTNNSGSNSNRTNHSSPKGKAAGGKSEFSRNSSPASKKYAIGDLVEARWQGFYMPGQIASSDRGDNSYNIEFTNGMREVGIHTSLIRPLESSSTPSNAHHKKTKRHSQGHEEDVVLERGSRVEARYKGKTKYYSGLITRVRLDGSYDIEYDDGEQESNVSKDLIRLAYSPTSRDGSNGRGNVGHQARDQAIVHYSVGDYIQAKFEGKGPFLSGRIVKARTDGSYDVVYDAGGQESRVRPEDIRYGTDVRGASSLSHHFTAGGKWELQVGDRVESQYKGTAEFIPGIVRGKHPNGTYDIQYDDGQTELSVAFDRVRALADTSPRYPSNPGAGGGRSESSVNGDKRYSSPKWGKRREDDDDGASDFSVGARVEARYKGKAKYYPGVVTRVRLDGSYDIEYSDGEKEARVSRDLIRPLDESGSGDKAASSRGAASSSNGNASPRDSPSRLRERLGGGGTSRAGSPLAGGRSEVRSSSIPKSTEKIFEVAERIEAHYKGEAAFTPGIICGKSVDGTYDIMYDTGRREFGVPAGLIRILDDNKDGKVRNGGPSRTGTPSRNERSESPASDFSVGARVEARYKGKAKYYPGVVTRVRLDGSYDIEYSDGEKEARVSRDLIRPLDGSGSGIQAASSRGAASSSNGNTSPRSSPSRLRERLGGGGTSRSGSPLAGRRDDLKQFKEGDVVEAKFEGKGRFLPARIVRDRGDSTYDLVFDDGGKDFKVPRKLIKHVVVTATSSTKTSPLRTDFIVGEKVEAQYKGESVFSLGVICGKGTDGTFDIEYDNGRVEFGAPASHIRRVGEEETKAETVSIPLTHDLRKGTRVEARYKGKTKYFKGFITRKRLDGLYDVEYDDGEKEAGVSRDVIRVLDGEHRNGTGADGDLEFGARAGGNRQTEDGITRPKSRRIGELEVFRIGETVEAKKEMKGVFFPGRVVRDRGDGTYDVKYEDGRLDTHVDAGFIRRPSTKTGHNGPSTSRPSSNYRNSSQNPRDSEESFNQTTVLPKDVTDFNRTARFASPTTIDRDGEVARVFQRGDRVQARFRGGMHWEPGLISSSNPDGTYNVYYQHHSMEEKFIPSQFIRIDRSTSLSRSRSEISPTKFNSSPLLSGINLNDRVEAIHNVTGIYTQGIVVRKNLDGTFDVQYDDGRTAFGVPFDLIRLIGDFQVGERVEAPYKGSAKYVSGVINRKRLNGTYDINYDNGELEVAIDKALIRKQGVSRQVAQDDSFVDSQVGRGNHYQESVSTNGHRGVRLSSSALHLHARDF